MKQNETQLHGWTVLQQNKTKQYTITSIKRKKKLEQIQAKTIK